MNRFHRLLWYFHCCQLTRKYQLGYFHVPGLTPFSGNSKFLGSMQIRENKEQEIFVFEQTQDINTVLLSLGRFNIYLFNNFLMSETAGRYVFTKDCSDRFKKGTLPRMFHGYYQWRIQGLVWIHSFSVK